MIALLSDTLARKFIHSKL